VGARCRISRPVSDRCRPARPASRHAEAAEEKDFREWKAALHEAYSRHEPQEHPLHLPDSRHDSRRHHAQSARRRDYLFDDVTESLQLARRFDALIASSAKRSTISPKPSPCSASDGRLRLHNPAFAAMWRLTSPRSLRAAAYRSRDRAVPPALRRRALWQRLRATITAIEGRDGVKSRLELRNGSVADLVTVPLPDGANACGRCSMSPTPSMSSAHCASATKRW